jgi:dethiobiotin synthetase
MKIFITGTDTNIGKTIVSSWLCLHTGYDYFKPIQTGIIEGSDSETVKNLSGSKIHKEAYVFKEPVSPHLAAHLENRSIDSRNIKLPIGDNLIVEGAGGLLVPINKEDLMIDLIKQFAIPVVLVASSRVGTINHTLLSLEALRIRNIEILGIIVNGEINQSNCESIEFYGKAKVLAQLPRLDEISKSKLQSIPLTQELREVL